MSTITREQAELKSFITGFLTDPAHDTLSANSLTAKVFRTALASLEAESAGWQVKRPGGNWMSIKNEDVDHYKFNEELPVREVYTAPPAPVSIPDEWRQWIADAVEYLKGDLEADGELEAEGSIEAKRLLSRRAAMLQGADGTLTNEGTIPVTQFKPVADLYGLTSPTGGETSFTFDAVAARDFIDGGWSCQEYVELERFQEAITNHTEDKLAMVDHYGDSNNMVEPVTTAYKLPDSIKDNQLNSGPDADEYYSGYQAGWNELLEAISGNSPVIPEGYVLVPKEPTEEMNKASWAAMNEHDAINPTYRAMLAAAPQQEVTHALAKGMERYGDAMQKLADSGD